MNSKEPTCTIGIVERHAVRHLDNVRGRMERIGLEESPAQFNSKQLAQRRFTNSCDTHKDYYHRDLPAALTISRRPPRMKSSIAFANHSSSF